MPDPSRPYSPLPPIVLVLTMLAAVLEACGPRLLSAPPHDKAQPGLVEREDAVLDTFLAKPGLDLTAYDKVHVPAPDVVYRGRPVSSRQRSGVASRFQLTAAQLQRFRERLRDAVETAVSRSNDLRLAAKPGSGVLELRARVEDLIIRVRPSPPPGTTVVTWVEVPLEMTLVAELRDSGTGETLARFGERKQIRSLYSPSDLQHTTVPYPIEVEYGGLDNHPHVVTAKATELFEPFAEMLLARIEQARARPAH